MKDMQIMHTMFWWLFTRKLNVAPLTKEQYVDQSDPDKAFP